MGAALSIGITLVVGVILFLSSRQVDRAVEQSGRSYAIVQKVFESNLLLNEYLLRHEDATAAKWKQANEELVNLLGAIFPGGSESRRIVGEIRESRGKAGTLFSRLAESNREQRKNRDEIISFLDFEEKMVGELARESGLMVALATHLAEISHAKATWAQKNAIVWVVVSTGILTSVLAMSLLMISRSVVRPLVKLKDATRIIADGNLEYTVEVAGNNEIGELALAFNAMTYKLKDMYKGLQDAFNEMSRKLREAKKETKE